MKQISNLVSLEDFKKSDSKIKDDDNVPFTVNDVKVINYVFETLTAIFPAFRPAWPTQEMFDNAKGEWLKAFRQCKITDIDTIERGLTKCREATTPFVPTPGQFISMCKKEISLVPDFYIGIESQKASPDTVRREVSKMMEFLKK